MRLPGWTYCVIAATLVTIGAILGKIGLPLVAAGGTIALVGLLDHFGHHRLRLMSDQAVWDHVVRKFLMSKLMACTTREGTSDVLNAMELQGRYPDLDGPQLIRLAHWGASGDASWDRAETIREARETRFGRKRAA